MFANKYLNLFFVCAFSVTITVAYVANANILDRIFGDECTAYSDFTCDQLENSAYNVFFYYPDNRELYLGQSTSLSQCNAVAVGHANTEDLSRNSGWGYVCCLIAQGSACYEKHR